MTIILTSIRNYNLIEMFDLISALTSGFAENQACAWIIGPSYEFLVPLAEFKATHIVLNDL